MEWMSGLSLALALKALVMTLNESWGEEPGMHKEGEAQCPPHSTLLLPSVLLRPSDTINKQTQCVRENGGQFPPLLSCHSLIYLFICIYCF
jgi:hypothetical protein